MLSLNSKANKNSKGFTLVELLIVVAIIGVLASQGVPAYKRMIQKSRKAEAKIALANIATSEAAFFSEYGEYGNNIQRMGAQMDASANLIYTAGWPQTNCTQDTSGIKPTSGNALPALSAGFSGYFATTGAGTAIGATTNTQCASSTMSDGTTTTAISTYTATATGYIRDTSRVCSNTNNCDQWTINQTRTVNNTLDGVGD